MGCQQTREGGVQGPSPRGGGMPPRSWTPAAAPAPQSAPAPLHALSALRALGCLTGFADGEEPESSCRQAVRKACLQRR